MLVADTLPSDKLLFIINRTIRNQVGDAKIVYLAAVSMSCEVRKLVESGKEFLLINDIAAKLGQSDAFNIVLPTDKEITHRPACSIKFDPRKGLSARRSSRCT